MDVVVALGTNLGDRWKNLRAAAIAIEGIARIVARSRVYETAPIGPPQPAYLNAAVRVDWNGDAHALLAALLGIERGLGRERTEKWGPRVIDLDILWIDGASIESETLRVPHPHLGERAFALKPLYDVAPEATDPKTGAPWVVPEDRAEPVGDL